jgi:FkbM family methyltransferase
MSWQRIRDRVVLSAKQLVYGRHGEPYEFAGQVLRFIPGTRPVRRKYLHSANWVNRDDVLEILWLESHLRENDIALDVGAHCGIYSVLMAARAAKVIAFEPDPYARAMLARNVELNSKSGVIAVEAFACSDREGEAVLFSRGGNSNSSFARSAVAKPSLPLEKISVSTITLDSYLALHGLSPNCVKIDTEGAEIRILKGASRLLASDALILCELHPYAWAEFANSLAELESLVEEAGREIRYLDPTRKPNTYGMTLLARSQ